MRGSRTAWGSIKCFALRDARHRFSVPRKAQHLMVRRSASPPSPSDPPRRDRPSRQISDCPPNSPDRALRFTVIRASERFRGRVALSALSGPLPRSAVTHARARNARHDAPRGPIRPHRQSTKRPASFPRRALNSPSETDPNFRWRSERPRGGDGRSLRTLRAGWRSKRGATAPAINPPPPARAP